MTACFQWVSVGMFAWLLGKISVFQVFLKTVDEHMERGYGNSQVSGCCVDFSLRDPSKHLFPQDRVKKMTVQRNDSTCLAYWGYLQEHRWGIPYRNTGDPKAVASLKIPSWHGWPFMKTVSLKLPENFPRVPCTTCRQVHWSLSSPQQWLLLK